MPPKRKPRKALSELDFNTLERCAAQPPGPDRWKAARDAGFKDPSATWANEKARKERHENGAKPRMVDPPPRCRKGIASTASSVSTTSVGTAAAVSSAVGSPSSAPPASFALVGLGGSDDLLSMLLGGALEGGPNGQLALKDSDLDEFINSL